MAVRPTRLPRTGVGKISMMSSRIDTSAENVVYLESILSSRYSGYRSVPSAAGWRVRECQRSHRCSLSIGLHLVLRGNDK